MILLCGCCVECVGGQCCAVGDLGCLGLAGGGLFVCDGVLTV